MLQKFLFIGTGGSGGATLRYLYREIDTRLRAAGWHEGVPEAFQFLHIDLPRNPGGVDAPDVPSSVSGKITYLGLGQGSNEFSFYDRRCMSTSMEARRLYTEFRPDPAQQYPSPYHGAGQIRLVGRIVSLAGLSDVQREVKAAAEKMMTQEAEEQLTRLSQKVDAAAIQHNQPARVMVVTSLAGGSGSGIFLDVLETLRSNASGRFTWLSKPTAVLYAPDVFGTHGQGIAPNSLAALSELVASVDHLGADTAGESGLAAHGPTPVQGRRGPDYTFMVGAASAGGGFTRPSEVFQATAAAFGAIALDGRAGGLLDKFENFVLANWQSQGARTPLVLRRVNNEGLCKGLGRASVTLGRRLFAQFAAERLAKESLDTLLTGHRKVAKSSERSRPDEDIIALVAERELADWFRAACGFEDTRGENTSITEALLPREHRIERAQTAMKNMLGKLRNEENFKDEPAVWRDSFLDRVQVASGAALGIDEAERSAAAKRWIGETQAAILNSTADVIGKIGLPATVKLLEGLEQEVRAAFEHSMRQSREILDQREPQYAQAILAVFDKLRAKVISPELEQFDEAADNAAKSLYFRSMANAHATAAELMESLADGFIPQLRSAVEVALTTLSNDLKDDAVKLMVGQWPIADVSAHLRPSPTDVLVEPYSSWPKVLDDLLCDQFSALSGQALQEVTSEIVSGRFERADQPGTTSQDLIAQSSEWWPEPAAYRPVGKSPSEAEFQFVIKANDVLERSIEWIADRTPGPVQLHVREQLVDYLSPRHPEAGLRAQAVTTALRSALPLARPLVSESESALEALYTDLTHLDVTFTLSPIPATSAMQADVVEALRSAGVIGPADNGLQYIDPSAKGDTIEIVSFHSEAAEPWAYASVSSAIADQYPFNSAYSGDFWIHRRARHLSAFTALSSSHQAAMARGIITANLLGDVQAENGDIGRQKIWSRKGERKFPLPLLTAPMNRLDVPGVLLESVALAFVHLGTGSTEELRAYERLFELGLDGDYTGNLQAYTTAAVAGYRQLNPELAAWVETGVRPAGATDNPVPAPTPIIGGGDPATRREALIDKLEKSLAVYRSRVAEEVGDSTFELDPRYQVAPLLLAACEQLLNAARNVHHEEQEEPIA